MSNKQNKHMKAIGSIVVITLIGKVLGLVRDMLLGHHFGTGMESSAFLVASRIPRTFFDAIFASAISASFIPVFNERLERHGKDDAFRLSNCFFTWVGLTTALFSGLGIVFAEPIVAALADGFDPETAALCASLLRILFPTVFFTGVAFSMVGVLQSMGQFTIPAAMSVVSNAIIIGYYLLFCRSYGIFGLAWAFGIGWAAQAVIQVPWLQRNGFRYRPVLRHEGLRQVFLLMVPVMVSTWIQPVNQLLSTRFATHLFDGAGASAMDYANTLYTILTGVLVLSITNVLFPEMSRLSSAGQERELGELLNTNLRGMLFLLIPLTAGVMLMAEPLVRLLYEWGSWDSFSTGITARALRFMSLGMVGYGLQNVLSRSFYAGQDGKTPVLSGVVSIAVNLALCLLLTKPMDVAGLSLATALSATAGALVLLLPTLRRFPELRSRSFLLPILSMLLCTLVMAAVVALSHGILSGFLPDTLFGRAALLGIPTVFGVAVYFVLAKLWKLPELSMLMQMFRK